MDCVNLQLNIYVFFGKGLEQKRRIMEKDLSGFCNLLLKKIKFTYHEVIGSCTKKKGKKKLILAILLALMIIG